MDFKVSAVLAHSSPGKRPFLEDALEFDEARGIFILADGFGGEGPGKEAASIGSKSIREFLAKNSGDEDVTLPFVLRPYFSLAGNVLFNAVMYANRKICKMNKTLNVHEKGGTSVVSAMIDGDLLALAQVGAGQAFLIRGSRLIPLTLSRCYGRMLNPGIDERVEKGSEVPLAALGLHDDLEPEIVEVKLQKGDGLLLLSEGVSSEVRSKLASFGRGVHEAESWIRGYWEHDGVPQVNSSLLLAYFD